MKAGVTRRRKQTDIRTTLRQQHQPSQSLPKERTFYNPKKVLSDIILGISRPVFEGIMRIICLS